MDVAAEFGVVLCYYSRLSGMYVITTNTLNCCFPHMNGYWHKQSLTHSRAVSPAQIGDLALPNATVDLAYHYFVSSPGDLRDKENTYRYKIGVVTYPDPTITSLLRYTAAKVGSGCEITIGGETERDRDMTAVYGLNQNKMTTLH